MKSKLQEYINKLHDKIIYNNKRKKDYNSKTNNYKWLCATNDTMFYIIDDLTREFELKNPFEKDEVNDD